MKTVLFVTSETILKCMCRSSAVVWLVVSVATAVFFSVDLFFFCFIWSSGVFIENMGFFGSGQILEMYVVLLYFPFKKTVVCNKLR